MTNVRCIHENYYSPRTHCFPVYAFTIYFVIGYSLILCPYTLDSMNSYKIEPDGIGKTLTCQTRSDGSHPIIHFYHCAKCIMGQT